MATHYPDQREDKAIEEMVELMAHITQAKKGAPRDLDAYCDEIADVLLTVTMLAWKIDMKRVIYRMRGKAFLLKQRFQAPDIATKRYRDMEALIEEMETKKRDA